jgi:hypothetical protein
LEGSTLFVGAGEEPNIEFGRDMFVSSTVLVLEFLADTVVD